MSNFNIFITDKAQVEIVRIFNDSDKSSALRLAVVGGGCSGLQYKIDFSQRKDKDNSFRIKDTVDVCVDPKSSIYLKDVVLDFKDGLNGKGFVFENPNAKNTCGCGESFSV